MSLARGVQLLKTCLWRRPLHVRLNGTASLPPSDSPDVTGANRIVWMDMEMTGLDVENCHILEVACLITDKDLKVVSDHLNIVVHQSHSILQNMNQWCTACHGKSGLISESMESNMSVEDTEKELLKFLEKYVPYKACPMAGNSIYMDRIFLNKYMPTAAEYLHHRLIDISTIKELAWRWDLNLPKVEKSYKHRALPDIIESVEELRIYREHIFVPKN